MGDTQTSTISRPRIRLGLIPASKPGLHREDFPFRRHWPAIAVLFVMDIVFTIPALTTFREALELWTRPEDLFNLVAALFTSFWLLGWSLAPIAMTLILLVLLIGKESIVAAPGRFEVQLGLSRLGLVARYDPRLIRNLRIEYPEKSSRKRWRGPHVAFDYGTGSGEFGSNLSEEALEGIIESIETGLGTQLATGEIATPAESDLPDPPHEAGQAGTLNPTRLQAVVSTEPAGLFTSSAIALIAANLVPLAGALLFDWDLAAVLVVYWAESAVIGFYNVLKIAVIARWGAFFYGLFFLGHFGGFMSVHFLFLYTIFLEDGFSGPNSLDNLLILFQGLWPALLALFLSHGYSFAYNFVGRGEYRFASVKKQMSEPYSRIVFMHLVIIFGGGLAMALGEIAPVLLLVISAKILFDVRAHFNQRKHCSES